MIAFLFKVDPCSQPEKFDTLLQTWRTLASTVEGLHKAIQNNGMACWAGKEVVFGKQWCWRDSDFRTGRCVRHTYRDRTGT